MAQCALKSAKSLSTRSPYPSSKKGTRVQKWKTYRQLVTGIVTFAILIALVGISPASAQSEGQPLPDGTTLTGELSVWESAAWPSTEIFVGYPDPSVGFTVDSVNGQNAWGPYSSVENALKGACDSVALPRATEHDFTTVSVNQVQFTGDVSACMALDLIGTAPSSSGSSDATDEPSGDGDLDDLTLSSENPQGETEDKPMVADPGVYNADEMAALGVECRPAKSAAMTVENTGSSEGSIYDQEVKTDLPEMGDDAATGLAIAAGECINEGLIVVRSVRYGVGGMEDVRALQVGNGLVVYCGKHGGLAYDCWENYVGDGMALYAACEQARGDIETIDVPGAFNYKFDAVLFNGQDVPAVCK